MTLKAAAARAPSAAQFQDTAITISRLLRDAKVDAPLRPRAVGALLLAAASDDGDTPAMTLEAIDTQVANAVAAAGLSGEDKRRLRSILCLTGGDYDHLAPLLPAVCETIQNLRLRSCFSAGIDFLGLFYEAFLRYGYDNNALGIVFTPRHITRFCVEAIGVNADDRVIDIACGTGGFLVAAHDAMCSAGQSSKEAQRHRGKQNQGAIEGSDTNPTVWALATLNMMFRGRAGEPRPAVHIVHGSCFNRQRADAVRGGFTRAFLNPPFSQGAEPERDFIDASMAALAPGGRCAVVVKAGIFADEEHARWRADFVQRHRVLGVISLPEDLFYPTSAPTSILLAEAGTPQHTDGPVFMARIWNDGFEKLKNKRVERGGCDLPEVLRCFRLTLEGKSFRSSLASSVRGSDLSAGAEWSPQEWLPQPALHEDARSLQDQVVSSLLRAVSDLPELAATVLDDFTAAWRHQRALPASQPGTVKDFFHVSNGRSGGEKHYGEGCVPYISSGDANNSIIRLVDVPDERELFAGGITVTAFGQACVQPWRFVARGNGGSSVRVLTPRFRMSFADLAWFAALINAQRWRFFYARMAIKSRIERLLVTSPESRAEREAKTIADKVREFSAVLQRLGRL